MKEERSLDEMIRHNWKQRGSLTVENQSYYDQMLLYLRASDASQRDVEELLLEWQDHLLQAQKEGKSACNVFGPDPEAYCREILEQLPRHTRWRKIGQLGYILWHAMMWGFAVHAFVWLLLPLTTVPFQADSLYQFSLQQAGSLLLIFITVRGVLAWIKHTAFEQAGVSWCRRDWIFVGLVMGVWLFWYLGWFWLDRIWEAPAFYLNPWVGLLLFGMMKSIDRFYFRRWEIF